MKITIFSIHSAGADKCSRKRVLILHVQLLAVDTAFWSGIHWIHTAQATQDQWYTVLILHRLV